MEVKNLRTFIATVHPDFLAFSKVPVKIQRLMLGLLSEFILPTHWKPTKSPPCNCMHLFQIRLNLGLISCTAQNSRLYDLFESTGVLREGGNFSAIHNR